MLFKIAMGAKVRDTITGFEGTVTGRFEYITGCRQYGVVGKGTKKKTAESGTYDEDRLVVLGPKKKVEKKNAGGPQFIAAPMKD